MNFKILEVKTKILFLLVTIFLYITLATFLVVIFTTTKIHGLFLLLTLWFASATSLLFHYLLWKNLDFLQNINLHKTTNLTFFTLITFYIILFPLICILTIAFLFIFTTIILIIIIINSFKKTVKFKEKTTVNY